MIFVTKGKLKINNVSSEFNDYSHVFGRLIIIHVENIK